MSACSLGLPEGVGEPVIWTPGDVSFRHRSPGVAFRIGPAPLPHDPDAQGGSGPFRRLARRCVLILPLGFRARQAVRHGPAAASQRLGVYSCRRGGLRCGGVGRRPGAGVHVLAPSSVLFRYPCSSPHLRQRPSISRILPHSALGAGSSPVISREGPAPTAAGICPGAAPAPGGRCHRTLHLLQPVGLVSLGAVKSRSILSSRPLLPATTSELCPVKCRGRSRPAFLASIPVASHSSGAFTGLSPSPPRWGWDMMIFSPLYPPWRWVPASTRFLPLRPGRPA